MQLQEMKWPMRNLLRLVSSLSPYKKRVLLAWVCVIGAGGFTIITPRLVAWAIDFGIRPQRITETVIRDGIAQEVTQLTFDGERWLLIVAALAIIASAILRGLFAYGQQYLGEWISQRVAYDLRNSIYDRLQRLSYAYHDQQQTGQLMSRATQDVESVRMFINFGVLRLAFILIQLFAVLVIMLVDNWRLALISWSFLPLIAVISTKVSFTLRPIWLAVQDGLGRMSTVLQENLSGMRVVKAFGREQEESEKFAGEARNLFNNSYTASRIQAVSSPLMTGLWMLSLAVTIWYGGREIIAGRLTEGELTGFMLYLTLLQMPVRNLGWMINLMARAQSSSERIFEILDAESAVKEKPDAVPLDAIRGHVRFENVSFAYDSISPVLNGINIDARPGEIVALLGPTGSGKTTVVNLMPRFYDVTGGRITIDSHDIRDVTLASLRQAIGIVQQDVFLFSATVRDNIAYGVPDASQDDIERAAKAARIHDFIIGLPDGYDTWVGERGVTLSGGQKQRIAIARVLLKNPPILVLDDSTSSVDTETEYLIQQALAEVMKGRTTFVIAQRLRTVKMADQILVLRDGKIVEQGRHEELLQRDGFYRQIYDLELRDQEEALERVSLPEPSRATAGQTGGEGR